MGSACVMVGGLGTRRLAHVRLEINFYSIAIDSEFTVVSVEQKTCGGGGN